MKCEVSHTHHELLFLDEFPEFVRTILDVIQWARFGDNSTILDARMTPKQLRRYCRLDDAGEQLLKQALTELGLSARTIADLAGEEHIRPEHVSEAIMYRRLDRQL